MWAQVINMLIGVWLMGSPAVLDYDDPARTNDLIVGPIIASVACIAIWQAVRGMRWLNLPLGLWMVAAPWLLDYESLELIHSTVVGLCVAGLSLVHGAITQETGGGWAAIWRDSSAATVEASRS